MACRAVQQVQRCSCPQATISHWLFQQLRMRVAYLTFPRQIREQGKMVILNNCLVMSSTCITKKKNELSLPE